MVEYAYNAVGELVQVTGPSGVLAYEYVDGCVARVIRDGIPVRRFGYAEPGRLSTEWRAETGEINYAIQTCPDGTRFRASASSGTGLGEITYDGAYRPVREIRSDGTEVNWDRSHAGEMRVSLAMPDGDRLVVTEQDDRSRRIELPGGSLLEESRDAAGRITSLKLGGELLRRQRWHFNGQPDTIEDEATAWRHEYRADGTPSRVLVTPPGEASSFTAWLGVAFDEKGRLTGLTDATGLDVKVAYDAAGHVTSVGGSRGRIDVARDEQAGSMTMQTSWGVSQSVTFDPAGRTTRTEVSDGPRVATTTFEGGRPVLMRHFDGGEVRVGYEDARVTQLRLADGVELGYDYDAGGRVVAVSLGDVARVDARLR